MHIGARATTEDKIQRLFFWDGVQQHALHEIIVQRQTTGRIGKTG